MKRPLLYPFTLLYDGITRLRNYFYDKGTLSSVQFSVPVISVGNLAMGGTGKTPHIEYLIRLLQKEYQLATLSRGYKRATKGFLLADEKSDAATIGDEPFQLFKKFPNTVVSVCEDRLVGIPQLLTLHPEVEVILLDDAFQHRRVRPGFQVLLTDYAEPFYHDHVLPAGNLRESRQGYKRAEVIIVSKCPSELSVSDRDFIRKKINPLPHQQVFFSKLHYGETYDFYSGQQLLTALPKEVLLISGIANSTPLVQHLEGLGHQVEQLKYPDHHYFKASDLEDIRKNMGKDWMGKRVIVTTEKDATRLYPHQQLLAEWALPIIILPVSVQLIDVQEQFDQLIKTYVSRVVAENAA